MTPVAARAVRLAGEDVRRRTAAAGNEFAAMLDIESGASVGDLIEGVGRRTVIAPHLDALQPGHAYVQVHAHPSSTPHSDQDGMLFAAQARLAAMVVVGLDGTWYVVSRLPGASPITPEQVLSAWEEALVALRPQLLARVRSGRLSRRAGGQELLHRVWVAIAPQLGLRYDRVRPNRPGETHGRTTPPS